MAPQVRVRPCARQTDCEREKKHEASECGRGHRVGIWFRQEARDGIDTPSRLSCATAKSKGKKQKNGELDDKPNRPITARRLFLQA
jgi:hypothetical protein